MILPLVTVLFTTLFLAYHYLLQPHFLSPLSAVPPAHWSSPFSPLWILHLRRRGQPNRTIHALHERHGPLLRLAPRELSVNCVDGGLRTIYGGSGYEKGDWYAAFRTYGPGVTNVFTAATREEHGRRKRWVTNVYAKSTLLASAPLRAVAGRALGERLLPFLRGEAGKGREVEMFSLFSGVAMDFVAGYIFGLRCGSDFLGDPVKCHRWVRDYKARQAHIFWPQEMPGLVAWADRMGLKHWLVPKWVDQANRNIEAWVMGMCDAAGALFLTREKLPDGSRAAVYDQLRTMMKKSEGEAPDAPLTANQRLEIASELLDHVAAGFDTTGITLTYLAWELSKPEHRDIQEILQQELAAHRDTLDFKALDSLPFLNAVVMESLRLHAAIPGIQPRVTPENAELGPPATDSCIKGIPAGIRVNSQAFTLHRNEQVFPEAEKWKPRRWINSEGKMDCGGDKARWFWAFGSGGRMCIGNNLAMLEMKSIVAAIWTNFTTTVANDSGMAHHDGYTAEPMGTPGGDYLRLTFTASSDSES